MRNVCRFVALLLLATSRTLVAHDVITTKVTWTREISRIVYDRCISCHRNGGTAFSLSTYEAARPWAKAIKEETLERRMPPYGAVKGFGDLKDDTSLTQEQLELITDWVEGGAPEGDANLLPKENAAPQAADAKPLSGSEFILDKNATLTQTATFVGVRPESLQEGATMQIVAQEPDGRVTALIWFYQYNPAFKRTYFFRQPVTLVAGTRIITSASDHGSVALVESRDRPTQSAASHHNARANLQE